VFDGLQLAYLPVDFRNGRCELRLQLALFLFQRLDLSRARVEVVGNLEGDFGGADEDAGRISVRDLEAVQLPP
jgi:hypothetical protein